MLWVIDVMKTFVKSLNKIKMIPIQIAEKQPQLNKNKSVALSNVYLLKEIEKKSPKTKIDTSLHQGTMHRKV